MKDKLTILLRELGDIRIKMGELLKYHTVNALGGPAQYFYIATTQRELFKVLNLVYTLKFPHTLLGSGTKLIISSEGLKGLVIKNRTSVIRVVSMKGKIKGQGVGVDHIIAEVDSGVSFTKLEEFCTDQGLEKVEPTSKLQATLGGSIAYDQSLPRYVEQLKVWEEGEELQISLSEYKKGEQVVISLFLRLYSV